MVGGPCDSSLSEPARVTEADDEQDLQPDQQFCCRSASTRTIWPISLRRGRPICPPSWPATEERSGPPYHRMMVKADCISGVLSQDCSSSPRGHPLPGAHAGLPTICDLGPPGSIGRPVLAGRWNCALREAGPCGPGRDRRATGDEHVKEKEAQFLLLPKVGRRACPKQMRPRPPSSECLQPPGGSVLTLHEESFDIRRPSGELPWLGGKNEINSRPGPCDCPALASMPWGWTPSAPGLRQSRPRPPTGDLRRKS